MKINLENYLKNVKGTPGIFYKDLITGETITYNSEREFKPASIIKLPTLFALYKMVNDGSHSFDEKIKIRYDMRVPSCGAFNAFTDEPVVDLKTLSTLMIILSDNTATNVIFDYIGIDNLNRTFKEIGLHKTHIERKLFDSEGFKKGLSNQVVPEEIGMLLEKMYKGTYINENISKEILNILLEQQCRWKIPAYIEEECQVGNKTGEADDITGDAAIILGERPFILITIFNNTESVAETDEWIRHFARDIYMLKKEENNEL